MEKHFKLHHAIYIIIFGIVCGVSWNSSATSAEDTASRLQEHNQTAIDKLNKELDDATRAYQDAGCKDSSKTASDECHELDKRVRDIKNRLRAAKKYASRFY